MEAPHLIQPHELGAGTRYGSGRWRGEDVWQVLTAARAGDLAALRGALERDSSLVSASYWYMPPLHFAVREGHLEAVRLLVAAGADLTHRNALYGNDTLLQMAEDRGHRQVAGFLREALDRRLSSAGVRHAVHEAVAGGDAAGLTRLLAADSRLADRGDHLGRRPLHYAVAAGRGDLVDLLLNAGADIDALGFGGDDRLGGAGFRPVALALWRDPYWGPRDDQAGHEALLRLLLARGLRVPPVVTYCPTYLWRALPLARLLLEHGMDPDLPNWQQLRPLHHIAGRGDIKSAELFLEFGADLDAVDEEFRSTPLGWAARCGQGEFVRFLLAHRVRRAEPAAVPAWAQPHAWARRRGHGEVAALLAPGA